MWGMGSLVPERLIDWFNPKEYTKWYHVLWIPIIAVPIMVVLKILVYFYDRKRGGGNG